MSGNVWEWTSTIYRDYPYNAGDGRESDNETNEMRVLRGGSWYDFGSMNQRTANRDRYDPSLEFLYVGFRCARDFEPSDLDGAG